MKRPLLFIFTLLSTGIYAQEHFSGMTTSRRTGLLNASINPAELTNIKNNFEVNVLGFSANVANNKISFSDLTSSDSDFEDLIFSGSEPVNMNVDMEIQGPGVAFKINKLEKWAFAVTTSAKVNANIVDVSTDLGRALTVNPVIGTGTSIFADVNSNYNQRVTSAAWGEIGISAARDIFENESHKFSAGITFKMIFPGTYANISADKFNGTIVTNVVNGETYATDAEANLNLAYSGALADDFNDASDFTHFFAGGLNGFSTDIGVNYQWKNTDSNNEGAYKINAGVSFRNLGSMKFKDDNNESKMYQMNVPEGQLLDLSQFEDVENFEDLEAIFAANPQYFTIINTSKDFRTKMPAMVSGYADYNVYGKWYATAYFQQKLNENNNNGQIAVQNSFSVTPRFSAETYEIYAPLSNNEISGFTAGIGFRLGGFYIGSGSAITAALSDAKQFDAYIGFRFGL
jgi:hypothetical protein